MSTTQSEAKDRFIRGTVAPPTKPCPACGALFYTATGLAEHARLGCQDASGSSPMWVRRIAPRPVKPVKPRGLKANRRRRCNGCGLVTISGALGNHQKATGHTGYTEAEV